MSEPVLIQDEQPVQGSTTSSHAVAQTQTVSEHTEPSGISALGVNGPVLVAQVLNFLLLLFILQRVLYKPLVQFLENRRQTIQTSLSDAEKARHAAESAASEAEAVIATARREARALLDDARAQSEQVAAQMQSKAASEAELLVERTREQLRAEKAALLSDTEQELAGLIGLATEKVLQRKSPEITTSDIELAIKELKAGV